jgi:hypothetical protein
MSAFYLLILLGYTIIVQGSINKTTYSLEPLKDYGPKTLSKIRWLHFPRAGSSFASTVVRYACDEPIIDLEKNNLITRNPPIKTISKCKDNLLNTENFYKYPPLSYEETKYAVIMFRKPSDRFASQLRWMRAMVRFIMTYGVAAEDVQTIMSMLNVVPNIKQLNSSNPCYYASKSMNLLRRCR